MRVTRTGDPKGMHVMTPVGHAGVPYMRGGPGGGKPYGGLPEIKPVEIKPGRSCPPEGDPYLSSPWLGGMFFMRYRYVEVRSLYEGGSMWEQPLSWAKKSPRPRRESGGQGLVVAAI